MFNHRNISISKKSAIGFKYDIFAEMTKRKPEISMYSRLSFVMNYIVLTNIYFCEPVIVNGFEG